MTDRYLARMGRLGWIACTLMFLSAVADHGFRGFATHSLWHYSMFVLNLVGAFYAAANARTAHRALRNA